MPDNHSETNSVRSWLLNEDDLAALERFDETADDDESYDLPKASIQRLAELGALRNHGFGRYSITSFGRFVLGDRMATLPLETAEECNDRLSREHRASIGLEASAAATPPEVDPIAANGPFQERVRPWLLACFGEMIAGDQEERNHRFLEEALELVQSLGCTASEAHQLVDYVFGRPVGEPVQEVGGAMVSLAALCLANDLNMHDAGEKELARILDPHVMDIIRAKQASKPKGSPFPGTGMLADSSSPLTGMLELTAQIRDQESELGWLKNRLNEALQASAESVIGQLRLREAVLLYVGNDLGKLEREIAKNYGSETAQAVLRHVFDLDRAPLTQEQRDAIRVAIDHGCCRW